MSFRSATITPYCITMFQKKNPKLLRCNLCGRSFSPYEVVYIYDCKGNRCCSSCLDLYFHDTNGSNPETISYIFVHPNGEREECTEVV